MTGIHIFGGSTIAPDSSGRTTRARSSGRVAAMTGAGDLTSTGSDGGASTFDTLATAAAPPKSTLRGFVFTLDLSTLTTVGLGALSGFGFGCATLAAEVFGASKALGVTGAGLVAGGAAGAGLVAGATAATVV